LPQEVFAAINDLMARVEHARPGHERKAS
jgi:hypothetical protein